MHRWCRAVVDDDDVEAVFGRVFMKSLPEYRCDDSDVVCGVGCRGFRSWVKLIEVEHSANEHRVFNIASRDDLVNRCFATT